jgi:hypothetical protein
MALIHIIAKPMRPWFYSQFKGEKDGMPRTKAHWISFNQVPEWLWRGLLGSLKVDGVFC